jgi:DNA-binding MarR family transcriptional regulator
VTAPSVKNLDIKILDEYHGRMTAQENLSPQDDVDRLIAAWQRERPDMDVSPMHVLSRVTRLALHLDRARRLAFDEWNLESSEFDVLSALRRAGTPYQLSPGQLVHETLVTSGTMTNRVDRLVNKGLVERLPDPADRRGVQVRLTTKGRAAVDGAIDALLAHEKELLVGLTDSESEQLANALRTLSRPFDR